MAKKSARVLGIDPATHTGIVAASSLRDCAPITLRQTDRKGGDRALWFFRQFDELFTLARPSLVMIEGYGYANKWTLVPLVEIGTAIRMAAVENRCRLLEVAPKTLKKFVTGNGAATKDAMRAAVKQRWGFEHSSHDVIDAYALAMAGLVCEQALRSTEADRLALRPVLQRYAQLPT